MDNLELVTHFLEWLITHINLDNGGTRIVLMMVISILIFFAEDVSKLFRKFTGEKNQQNQDEENDELEDHRTEKKSRESKDILNTQVDGFDELLNKKLKEKDLVVIMEMKDLLEEHHAMSKELLMRWNVRMDRIEDIVGERFTMLSEKVSDLKRDIDNNVASKLEIHKTYQEAYKKMDIIEDKVRELKYLIDQLTKQDKNP